MGLGAVALFAALAIVGSQMAAGEKSERLATAGQLEPVWLGLYSFDPTDGHFHPRHGDTWAKKDQKWVTEYVRKHRRIAYVDIDGTLVTSMEDAEWIHILTAAMAQFPQFNESLWWHETTRSFGRVWRKI